MIIDLIYAILSTSLSSLLLLIIKNIFDKRLSETEKYLIAIQLVDKISESAFDNEMHYIIESILINKSN